VKEPGGQITWCGQALYDLAGASPATTFLAEKSRIRCSGGACPRQVLVSATKALVSATKALVSANEPTISL